MSIKQQVENKYLIGLDIGTSSVKGIIISEKGNVLSVITKEIEHLTPKPGFIEIDPEEHYALVCSVIKSLSGKIENKDSIAAIGMAIASGNSLLLDIDGNPLINIISWMDQRAVGKRQVTLPGIKYDEHLSLTGWPWSDSFPLAVFAWYKKYYPEIFNKADYFCMNSDYLYYKLTGKKGMDPSTGTTFFMINQTTGKWHRPYLEKLGIPENKLAKLFKTGTILGPLKSSAAADCGITNKSLAVLGSFDHPSAARAMGIFEPGDLLLSCGTSWVGFYPIKDRDLAIDQNLLIDPFLQPHGPWGGLFSIPYIGQTVDWYLDNVIIKTEEKKEKYAIFGSLAKESCPGANGLFISPFFNLHLNRPFDSTLFSSEYTRQDIARAVMEGIAYEMKYKLDNYTKEGICAKKIVMVGGPSESDIWPQVLSEITGLKLFIPNNGQIAGALGATMIAGIGIGVYKNEKEGFNSLDSGGKTISPEKSMIQKYFVLYKKYMERKKKEVKK